MPGAIGGRDEACPACGRRVGEHTLDEWDACLGATTLDQEFGPAGSADAVTEAIRERFGLDGEPLIADHVIVEAAILDGQFNSAIKGPTVKIPTLIHNFALGVDGSAEPVARVLYMADVEGMRRYGALVGDAAIGAAKAAAR